MLALAALLSLAIGILLGMLGGGGAILTLPMLVYAVGLDPKAGIATSLFVVGATSLGATVLNARAKTIAWRVGVAFGAAAMVGAFAGGHLAALVPAAALLLVFAATMLATAIGMLRRRSDPPAASGALALPRVLVLGAAVGLLSGLVGAGGGFLIVPALSVFGRLPMNKAIATSLFVIVLQSFAGFAGHVGHTSLDWPVVAVVTAATVVGMLAGRAIGGRISAANLRRGFAWLVLAMGLFVIAKQASLLVTALVAAVTVTAVLLVTRTTPAIAR